MIDVEKLYIIFKGIEEKVRLIMLEENIKEICFFPNGTIALIKDDELIRLDIK